MKITLSVIKADIGSIGGHIAPSKALEAAVREHVEQQGRGVIIDHHVSHTADNVIVLMTHTAGTGDQQVHKLA